jgi:DNA-binding NarL/FixJ family response regulator
MKLTTRQRQIVKDIAAGLTNKEIAAHLGRRETTIKWHVARMMRQAGAPNRASLVEMFHRDRADEDRGEGSSSEP